MNPSWGRPSRQRRTLPGLSRAGQPGRALFFPKKVVALTWVSGYVGIVSKVVRRGWQGQIGLAGAAASQNSKFKLVFGDFILENLRNAHNAEH